MSNIKDEIKKKVWRDIKDGDITREEVVNEVAEVTKETEDKVGKKLDDLIDDKELEEAGPEKNIYPSQKEFEKVLERMMQSRKN
ncbi:hypothetical protein ACRXCV_14120 [Halobacteriovorax sp. GFR7]|uniref:hypothetical protein n=1 Tax=unclassified Halobacteriovorax TaxID=2639665 RepID=UPI003D99A29D